MVLPQKLEYVHIINKLLKRKINNYIELVECSLEVLSKK